LGILVSLSLVSKGQLPGAHIHHLLRAILRTVAGSSNMDYAADFNNSRQGNFSSGEPG
jgi:hypothetical protein